MEEKDDEEEIYFLIYYSSFILRFYITRLEELVNAFEKKTRAD